MLKLRTGAVRAFVHDERRSAVAIFFAMSVALLLAGGAAVDYARVINMREGIETATKAASEASLRALSDHELSDEEVTAVGLSHFEKGVAFARHVGTIEAPTVILDRDARSVTVGAKGIVSMTVSRLAGLKEVAVPATHTASAKESSVIGPLATRDR